MPTTMRGFRSGEVWDDALTIATARGESLSSVLNDALRRYVRRHGAPVAGQTAAQLDAPATRDASGDGVELIDLYHRTTPEAAKAIYRDRRMISRENTRAAYFSTVLDGEAAGYGTGVVHIRVPAELAEMEDEFPSGELHYVVNLDALRPEHFIATRDASGDA